ncbi:MAG: hypothetical protein WA902_14975 [Thermosynechococcaceae cyanobacterium]
MGTHRGYVVDYRLRMWLLEAVNQVPHGIFQVGAYRHVNYQGEAIEIPCLPDPLFQILSMSNPFLQR